MKEIDWRSRCRWEYNINPLNAKLNPICHLLASLEAHHIFHISRLRVKIDLQKKNSVDVSGLD